MEVHLDAGFSTNIGTYDKKFNRKFCITIDNAWNQAF